MPIEILMPALSPTMKMGKIVDWSKAEGDAVSPGDVLFKVETDKAVMEVESSDKGVLGKIIVGNGTENVSVNSVVAMLLTRGENPDVLDNIIADLNRDKLYEKNGNITEKSINDNIDCLKTVYRDESCGDRIFATPLARKIAADNNINLYQVYGSGDHGRIVKSDVLDILSNDVNNMVSSAHNLNTHSDLSISEPDNMRKVVAERLSFSKREIPHFYLTMDSIVDNLLLARAKINECAGDVGLKVTVNDLIIKAVALSLSMHPEMNVSWREDGKIVHYKDVDISVAVSIKSGLITPIVRKADQLRLIDLSREVKRLIKCAQDNALKLDEFQGGSFTISNMGMFGVKEFQAIINPPQSAILAIGAADKRVVVVDDKMVIKSVLTCSLSVDHRVVDGVVAAKFAKTLRSFLENPYKMI
ncbi:Dihydrolipoyllysine-residue acetyltransferase component of pyruvate dehydrogenase complex [Candidatus Xenohaliotis californiensis]|uniref:Dihydrolipoamide acetyltransferase component of pyruvate dehydrogenase complex n=1 Tax=Candidatus Xenohaliotis californiensis TaxID=84677 RepID=A0ABP0EXD0_9RICK|nr:Dihydrolipoyllysine-residue acetyltransferase component of pyruvate dehydrogenase complex [Candidatus Xenohaliotis californiensis]